MVKSWPSCWMTMPGRSCVALTLLIFFCGRRATDGSLGSLLISEIPAGEVTLRQTQGKSSLLRCSRNDSRHAGAKSMSSANIEYKGHHSSRSIFDFPEADL